MLPGSAHYLPHRAVVKENRETTKVRIVFDGSPHSTNESSINDVLYSGPCLLPLIFDILIRFCTGKIGIVADVKQAFHQMEIVKEHCDFLRFFWFEDILYNQETINLRFKRVNFGLTCSPFLLNGTIKEHLQKYLPLHDYREVVLQLLENLYVDDSSNSFNGIEQCLNFYEKSKKYLADANLHPRKWATNDSLVQNIIDDKENESEGTPSSNPQHDDETYVQNPFGSSSKYRKVLGINWDTRTDYFVFEFANLVEAANRLQVTKCNILKISAMFFDPLGVVCPIVLNAKVLFQETYKKNYHGTLLYQLI